MELLLRRHNSRFYQNQTSVDIIKQLFGEAGLQPDMARWVLQESYRPRKYCVQY